MFDWVLIYSNFFWDGKILLSMYSLLRHPTSSGKFIEPVAGKGFRWIWTAARLGLGIFGGGTLYQFCADIKELPCNREKSGPVDVRIGLSMESGSLNIGM